MHSPDDHLPASSTLTQLIHRAQTGDRAAADALYASTYADLRRLARSRLAARRGGDVARVPFDEELAGAVNGEEEILSVHQALDRIAAVDPRMADVVEMRYEACSRLRTHRRSRLRASPWALRPTCTRAA